MNLKNLAVLAISVSLFASCFKKKPDQSSVTGWNYNDSKMGGFQVSKEKEQHTGPGLVFVQGGTFTQEQARAFERAPYWQEAVLLRRFDDMGKLDEMSGRCFADYLPMMRKLRADASAR